MKPYEIVIKVNEAIIKDKVFSEDEKKEISNALLQAVSERCIVASNKNASNTVNCHTARMYPLFYRPLYDEWKKYRTITMVTPRTQLLAANSYELEILRILALFNKQNERVNYMLQRTKERLSEACFSRFSDKGECFETSIIALRFICTVWPHETELMRSIIYGINSHFEDKKRHSGTVFYYRLVLSELPQIVALSEIKRFKNTMLQQLEKSYIMNSENDKYINVLAKYILRNCLSRLPEFEYIKERTPFISEKDGRLYFDTTRD